MVEFAWCCLFWFGFGWFGLVADIYGLLGLVVSLIVCVWFVGDHFGCLCLGL